MNCVNCRVRSEKYKKYIYCAKRKERITFAECSCCEEKEYKKVKPIRHKKHKRTKATDIPYEVKVAVWNRDNHRCVFCGKVVGVECANAHFIPRSAGGLGIEENIYTGCPECHNEQDNGLNTKLYDANLKRYLKGIYGEKWSIEELIYKKY